MYPLTPEVMRHSLPRAVCLFDVMAPYQAPHDDTSYMCIPGAFHKTYIMEGLKLKSPQASTERFRDLALCARIWGQELSADANTV